MDTSTPSAASWAFAEAFRSSDPISDDARIRAAELGCTPIGAGSAALLQVLAAAVSARRVVEVGTGAGVSGLALLRGMRPDGVLTTIDIESEHQRHAREIFAAEGIPAARARLIKGRALEVLPRLSDDDYDIVFIDGDKAEYPALVEQGARLLRSGGLLILDNMLWHDRVADPAQRDPETVTLRGVAESLRSDERFTAAALVPSGDGLLVAVRL